jgi:hypothetical protein
MQDQFAYYRQMLAFKAGEGDAPARHDGRVECGLYWTKSKEGHRTPVAIFEAGGDLKCRFGTKARHLYLTPYRTATRWPWICENAVLRDAYVVAWETGTWPDGTPAEVQIKAGSNLPTDPFERLKIEVDDKISQAEEFLAGLGASYTKTDADKARNIQAALLAFNKSADVLHKAEKQPLLEQTRAVDDKFRFREKVAITAQKLRSVFERFMRDEEMRQKKAAEERFEADRRRIAAELDEIEAARKKKLADDPIAALTEPAPELPVMPSAPEAVKVNVGGGVGRAAGLRTEWVGVIVDYDKALAHFKNHDDVKALIDKLVARSVKASKSETSIPGVAVKQERRAI